MVRTTNDARARAALWTGAVALAVGVLLIGGLIVPPSANATEAAIELHNDTAKAGTDCPTGGGAAWHFVFAPNDGTASFATITLNLTTETVVFSGDQIVPNGKQTDNVFVAVPAGHLLTDLVTAGSSATYTGATPSRFNLSHVCEGTVPSTTTTTTAPSTTTTTAPATTTTTAPATTTTTAPSTTTTTAPATTTTTAPSTTTTTAPSTTTTTAPATTTTTAPSSTTTTAPAPTTTAPSTTTPAEVAPGVSTAPAAAANAVAAAQTPVVAAAAVQSTTGSLPVTGGAQLSLAVLGGLLLAGGAALLLGRRRIEG